MRKEGFSGGSVVKNPPANAGDMGLIPGSGRFSGSGRSPAEGNGKLLKYSLLKYSGGLQSMGLQRVRHD